MTRRRLLGALLQSLVALPVLGWLWRRPAAPSVATVGGVPVYNGRAIFRGLPVMGWTEPFTGTTARTNPASIRFEYWDGCRWRPF